MEERRQLLLKIAKQLRTVADFIEGIEGSLRIMVELRALEPQLETVLGSLKQAHQVISGLHGESLVPIEEEKKRAEQLQAENELLKEQIHKLMEESKLSKSQE